jgi:hypothetical protein
MKGKITIEEAVSKIDRILDKSEREFYDKTGRYPNLLEERDYVLLAESLDCWGEASQTNYFEEMDGEKYEERQIVAEDVAYRLMKRFFQREDFFKGEEQDNLFNGFFGRVFYNPPMREKEFRISAIEDLIKKSVPFPVDYENFLDTLGKIAGNHPCPGTCFLPTIRKDVQNKPGFEKVGTHLVNPSGYTLRGLRQVANYEELIKKCNRTIGDEEELQYK